MVKIRINDLARELEVKSRVVLDALLAVGFTEHKTHSSAVDEDVAEKVRRYLRGEAAAQAPASAAAPVQEAAPLQEEEEKPAKVKKPTAPPAEVPAAVAPPEAPVQEAPAAEAAPASKEAPSEPAPSAPALRPALPVTPAAASTPRLPVPPVRPVYRAPAPPVAPSSGTPSAASPGAAAPSAPSPAPARPALRPSPRPAPPVSPSAPIRPTPATPPPPPNPRPAPSLRISGAGTDAAPSAPARRVIVPVAGERPVYAAPPPSARPVAGQPIARNLTARPAPGKPIYQRPAGPSRAGMMPTAPEGRRPMHPTRTPAGTRPALPPRGTHARREPRSKEGPLKFEPQRTAPTIASNITITISEGVTVKELSERLGLRAKDVIRKLFDRGLMVTVNQPLETEVATQIAAEFGSTATTVSLEEETMREVEQIVAEDPSKLKPRAPVVTIMGHVDHGKTSLLDAIRETAVAAGEAGGITQHIGAYKVAIADAASPAYGRDIVFIDTPGHEAFTRMRARGARVTDVVVLVVAADDGVMPQTLEAIDHAKAANVPIIVAVNKIDKPDAQPDRVKKQLADRGLMPEAWGGQTVMVDVSAKARINLNHLLEMIILVTDLQENKADSERPAQGTVLEAQLDRGRGPVARVLVQNGTLRTGDTMVLGSVLARVRAMFDDRGRALGEAAPSTPVEVLGLESLPDAGESFVVINDRFKAKQIVLYREQKDREAALARSARRNLEALSAQMAAGDVKELTIILKTDFQGSEEVLTDAINRLSTDKVKVRIIHSGVGAVTESDVLLASASNAVIFGFNVKPERKGAEMAEQEKVDIRQHSIIYELTEEIKLAMHGLLEPTLKEVPVGRAEVKMAFRIPKAGTIAGCLVRDGKISRDVQIRVLREGKVVHTGKVSSLKRFKDDAREVTAGMECGIGIANFNDFIAGDVLEAFHIEKVAAPMLA